MLKTHGAADDHKKGRQQPVPTVTPEELPNLRTVPTGLGPGQVFLFDPRSLHRSGSVRR